MTAREGWGRNEGKGYWPIHRNMKVTFSLFVIYRAYIYLSLTFYQHEVYIKVLLVERIDGK